MKNLNPPQLLFLVLGLSYGTFAQTDHRAAATDAYTNAPGEFPNGQRKITKSVDWPEDIAIGDLDGDGDLDVLSASFTDNRVDWYANDGKGNFSDQRPINTLALGAFDISVGDLDSDGDLDVVSVSYLFHHVVWYPNDGKGNFGSQRTISFTENGRGDVVVADLDGDGDLDVLSMYNDNMGSPRGHMDWYANDGSGNFGPQRTIATGMKRTMGITTGDLDGDGHLDVLTTTPNDDSVTWYRNDGRGNFDAQRTITIWASAAREVAVADLDRDGDLDVLSASVLDDRIAWYRNDGNGNFGPQRTITTDADAAQDVTTGDLDGDGNLDVLSASFSDDRVAWYRNEGNGNFGTQQIITAKAVGAWAVASGDLDGDGDLDVLSASVSDDHIAWYENAEPPKANCVPTFTLSLDANGQVSITVDDIDNASTGATGMDIDITEFDCSNLGAHTVTLTVYNAAGTTDRCTTIVTIEDVSAPLPDMALLPEIRGECGATLAVPPTATDNCAGAVSATTTDPLSYGEQGTFTVTWTYDDGNGNTSTQEQTVIVEDVSPPLPDITLLPGVTGECGATVLVVPTATDNCTGTVTATTIDPLSYGEQGTYTVNWTYDDGNGNTSTQQQTVIVKDVTPPLPDMALLPDVRGQCGATVGAVPTATDNCAGTINASTTDPLSYGEQGTFTVTWTYVDGNGNIGTQEQTVIVEDLIPPMAVANDITVKLDAFGRAAISPADIDGGSADNCGIASRSLDLSTFECPPLAGTEVTLTVTDLGGNTASATATVTFEATDDNSDGVADSCGFEAKVYPNKGISPNGDGINDTWVIKNISDYPQAQIKVFDRNGREVFRTDHYANDWGATKSNGQSLLPVGPYYYVLHLDRPSVQNVTGWIYINY